jgi:hypothetical protein
LSLRFMLKLWVHTKGGLASWFVRCQFVVEFQSLFALRG